MASPFPGMDPYLETSALWSDFHASFVTYWRDALIDCLPSRETTKRIDEKVNLVEVFPSRRKLGPRARRGHSPSVVIPKPVPAAPAGVATLEPVTLSLVIEEETHKRHIEILRPPDRTLVAVLELLCPANKEEPGRTHYLAKRNALVHHPVHLVELDLLLKGRRFPLSRICRPAIITPWCRAATVDRSGSVCLDGAGHALPAIPIPLLPPDPDVWFDLAAVFATTYERGRYRGSVDYAAPLPVVPSTWCVWRG